MKCKANHNVKDGDIFCSECGLQVESKIEIRKQNDPDELYKKQQEIIEGYAKDVILSSFKRDYSTYYLIGLIPNRFNDFNFFFRNFIF